MLEEFIGKIILFAFNFVPEGARLCDGAALSISENMALYSVIGKTYGGNDKTFNLPKLIGTEPHPAMRFCIVTSGLYPTRD